MTVATTGVTLTMAELRPHHLGRTVTVPGLHQPGADFNAPPVAVTGTLKGYAWTGDRRWQRVLLTLTGSGVAGTFNPSDTIEFEDPT